VSNTSQWPGAEIDLRRPRDLSISDEAVRVIENRVLDALRHGLALEANGQPITAMRLAKAFRQPVASQIGAGRDTRLTA
jgi:Interferon-regulatory factor 3